MGAVLHAIAIACMVCSTVLNLSGRGSGRVAATVTSIVTLAAMADLMRVPGALPPVAWAGVLLAVALASTGVHTVRSDRRLAEKPVIHAALCALGMAAITMATVPPVTHATVPLPDMHHHAAGSMAILLLLPAAHGLASLAGAVRCRGNGERTRCIVMGLGSLAMVAGAVTG